MNKILCLILALSGLMTVASSVSAQSAQIYTWTDENGVVHYVDRQPDNPNAVSMEVPETYPRRNTDVNPQAVLTDSANTDQATATDEGTDSEEEVVSRAEQKRRDLAKKREERRLAQAEEDLICARARSAVERLEPSRRVFITNDEGEIERVDDEERIREIERAKALVADYCQ